MLRKMDLYPLVGAAQKVFIDRSSFAGDTGYNLDFNGYAEGTFNFRGAYAGDGQNPGWRLGAGLKANSPQHYPTALSCPHGLRNNGYRLSLQC